jgi:hypothetical protein
MIDYTSSELFGNIISSPMYMIQWTTEQLKEPGINLRFHYIYIRVSIFQLFMTNKDICRVTIEA